jgi:hypothetical protein
MKAREILDDTPVYLIGYDLHSKTDTDYTNINNAIKELFPRCWNGLDSTWLVRVNKSPEEIIKALKNKLLPNKLDVDDKLLVVRIGKGFAVHGFDKHDKATLKSQLS